MLCSFVVTWNTLFSLIYQSQWETPPWKFNKASAQHVPMKQFTSRAYASFSLASPVDFGPRCCPFSLLSAKSIKLSPQPLLGSNHPSQTSSSPALGPFRLSPSCSGSFGLQALSAGRQQMHLCACQAHSACDTSAWQLLSLLAKTPDDQQPLGHPRQSVGT